MSPNPTIHTVAPTPRILEEQGACSDAWALYGIDFIEPAPSEKKDCLAFCNRCPVTATCLEYALENDQAGIWGGTDERGRNRIRRQRWERRQYANQPLDPDDPRHGTLSGYKYWRCRCQACSDATAEYQAQLREARRNDTAA